MNGVGVDEQLLTVGPLWGTCVTRTKRFETQCPGTETCSVELSLGRKAGGLIVKTPLKCVLQAYRHRQYDSTNRHEVVSDCLFQASVAMMQFF
jgi:hypothetical protein